MTTSRPARLNVRGSAGPVRRVGLLHLRPEPRQDDPPVRRPAHDVDVERRALDRAAAEERQALEDAGRRAVDGLAVGLQPGAHLPEPGDELGLDPAVGLGADVEQEIAALADDLDELADELGRAVELRLVAVVAPAVPVHGVAGLPEAGRAVGIADARGRDVVLGRAEIAEAGLAPPEPVVDEERRLHLEQHLADGEGPLLLVRVLPLAVEPEHGRVVLRHQLLELVRGEVHVAAEVGALGRPVLLPGPAGQVIGMVPVHDRVVEPERDAGLLHRDRERAEDILAVLGVHDVVVGVGAVEDGEAVVVLRSDDDVLDARLLGQRGPFVGIEVDRIEIVGVVLVLLERDLEELAGPLLAADHGVDAPVDEQAELGLAEPLQAVGTLGLGRSGGRRGRAARPRARRQRMAAARGRILMVGPLFDGWPQGYPRRPGLSMPGRNEKIPALRSSLR